MSEHSPGPWRYDHLTGKIRDANGVAIANDERFGGPAETPTLANMLLMSAAPSLAEEMGRLASLARLAHRALGATNAALAADVEYAADEAIALLERLGKR